MKIEGVNLKMKIEEKGNHYLRKEERGTCYPFMVVENMCSRLGLKIQVNRD